MRDLRSNELEVVKCLFFHGPTWDGNIPSKQGRNDLCGMGLAHHEFGFAWLTREGVEYAVKTLQMDRAKEKWERDGQETTDLPSRNIK